VSDDADRHDMQAGVAGAEAGADAGAPVTGHPQVDEVLASLDGVEQLTLADQVAVLERAHQRLRGALDGAVEAGAHGHGA
jgi:hypothetical protein